METETESKMDCRPDGPGHPVRLNRCPFCTLSFTDKDRLILQAHIQHHFDSLRVPHGQCGLSRRCHEFQAENSDQLAQHTLDRHIKTRQCKSNSNRVQRAMHRALVVRDRLIQRLAENDPENQNRPFARPPNPNAPARAPPGY